MESGTSLSKTNDAGKLYKECNCLRTNTEPQDDPLSDEHRREVKGMICQRVTETHRFFETEQSREREGRGLLVIVFERRGLPVRRSEGGWKE